jgi:signal transduction histidine kinase
LTFVNLLLIAFDRDTNLAKMTSHEIRNPLSAVLHCAEEIIVSLSEYTSKTNSSTTTNAKSLQVLGDCPTVKVKELLEDTIEAAQTIAYCVHHQKRIVDDVLTLSKLDSNLLTISPTPVQPAKVAREALKIFEGELRTAGISMDFLEDLSLRDLGVDWVLLDPSRLLQVLLNLTTNAIKFTRGKPERNITVKVSASHQKPSELGNEIQYFPQREQPQSTAFSPTRTDEETLYLSIAVKDTGRGLSHEEKKLLFNRFSQGSPKTHVKYGGSGLGLFISR